MRSVGAGRFGLFTSFLLLAGCALNVPHRDDIIAPSGVSLPFSPDYGGYAGPAHQQRSFEEEGWFNPKSKLVQRYSLAYVEFDERGDFWDRTQLELARKMLGKISKDQSDKPVVLVEYIHGWHNDSSDASGDVANFHNLLARLEASDSIHGKYQVFGVYQAWRGETIRGGTDPITQALFMVPHELTFFARKAAAERVAGEPMCESLYSLVATARKANCQSKTVLVGHSFGALILEKTLAQALPATIFSQNAGDEKVKPPADLVLFLNSAADSMIAKETSEMFHRLSRLYRLPTAAARWTEFVSAGGDEKSLRAAEQALPRPWMVHLTSTGDDATGLAFPIGTSLSNMGGDLGGSFRFYEPSRKGYHGPHVDQWTYVTTTPGHNDHLITADIVPDGGALAEEQVTAGKGYQGVFQDNLKGWDTDQNLPHWITSRDLHFVIVPKPNNSAAFWKIVPRPGVLQTPFWIVTVDPQIIADHGDIYNEGAMDLMASMFRLAQAPAPPASAKAPVPNYTGPRTLLFDEQ